MSNLKNLKASLNRYQEQLLSPNKVLDSYIETSLARRCCTIVRRSCLTPNLTLKQ